jgi:hypothetical protein
VCQWAVLQQRQAGSIPAPGGIVGGRQSCQQPRSGGGVALVLLPEKHQRQPHLPSDAGSDGTEQLEAHVVHVNDLTR